MLVTLNMVLIFSCKEMNLQDVVASNKEETIIIFFTDVVIVQTEDRLTYKVNNQGEYSIKLSDFDINYFIGKYKLCKFISKQVLTATQQSHESNKTSEKDDSGKSDDLASPVGIKISVPSNYVVSTNFNSVTMQTLLDMAVSNGPIDMSLYPDPKVHIHNIVFTNDDETVIMYYNGMVMESNPPQFGYHLNCDSDRTSSYYPDYWVDAYHLHPVFGSNECDRLQTKCQTLPSAPTIDYQTVVRSPIPWSTSYYNKTTVNTASYNDYNNANDEFSSDDGEE